MADTHTHEAVGSEPLPTQTDRLYTLSPSGRCITHGGAVVYDGDLCGFTDCMLIGILWTLRRVPTAAAWEWDKTKNYVGWLLHERESLNWDDSAHQELDGADSAGRYCELQIMNAILYADYTAVGLGQRILYASDIAQALRLMRPGGVIEAARPH